MPARDTHHEAVKSALMKEGWTITHDPYWIAFGGKDAYADLAAERQSRRTIVAAERGIERIAVEIKTFGGASVIADLQQAIGQYALYRSWMRQTEPDRVLYLAVDREVARSVFASPFGQVVANDVYLQLVVIDMYSERIVEWSSFPATDKS